METGTRVIREEKDFVVLFKESGLDSVPLKREGESHPSLFKYASSLYPEIKEAMGKNCWEGGIIHRLDNPTSGLVLAARNKKFYEKILYEQRNGNFLKHYRAETERTAKAAEGFPPFPYVLKNGLDIKSKFRPFGAGSKSVRPLTETQFRYKEYETVYCTHIDRIEDGVFHISLDRGFRHQIRCHLAWSKNPIKGDVLYGARASGSFGLICYGLEFLGEEIWL